MKRSTLALTVPLAVPLAALLAVGLAMTHGKRAEAAPCGPTFCPSYTTCRVKPHLATNPAFSELSDLFDDIAPGPSVYGSLGWTYSLMLGDGIGKPYGPTKVPARFPCVLLKAISVQESVGWHQFCVPTGPTCTGTSQTIISFDCGFGLMQVTSGMRAGDTSAYDPNRVASDPAYNVSVGSQILGSKWTVTPSVGDNRVDVIEDWYIAVWAYNGLAFSNNPNNPAHPADRKPYRDPGGLSAANYPYQEVIWGYMRVPYGLKESAGVAAYPGYPLSYPNRAELCASCGSPKESISDPSPTHLTDCPGGTSPGLVPLLTLSTATSANQRVVDGTSRDVVDVLEGDDYAVDLLVQNGGEAAASAVTLGVDVGEPWVSAVKYVIESDAGHPGTFALNDANDRTDNPPHDAPGKALVVHMNAFAPKETKRIHLEMKAQRYSIGALDPKSDHPAVRFWVQDVPGVYAKASFDAKPVDTSGAQKFNGGDLRAAMPIDVFSRTLWSFDGGTLEGWTGSGGADVALGTASNDASMVITAKGDDPIAIGPDTDFDAKAYGAVKLRARTSLAGGARVYFTTREAPAFSESRAIDVALAADGAMHEAVVDFRQHPDWKGTITKLRIDPASKGSSGAGTDFVIDEVRVLRSDEVPAGEGASGSSGCGCRIVGRDGDGDGDGDADGEARSMTITAMALLSGMIIGLRSRASGRHARARRAAR